MSKRTTIIVVIAVLAVLALCCCLAVGLVLAAEQPWASGLTGGALSQARNVEAASESTQQFGVGANPLVVIDGDVGSVEVSAGTTGVVTVVAEVHARAASDTQASDLLSRTIFNASGDTDRVTVSFDVPDDVSRVGSVDVQLTVTVPSGSRLQVHTQVGDVTARGTRGEAELGTNVGNVTWVGALPDSGALTLTTSVGNASFEAPAESAFHLDATTSNGRVNSALALAGGDGGSHGLLADSAVGDYGSDPQLTVKLHTDVGNVDVTVR